MAKKNTNLLGLLIGVGGAVAATVLSKKENRDMLKNEYNKYKENPESYKQDAKKKATDLSSKATEEFNRVKQDPKTYMEEVKKDPKAFVNQKKGEFTQATKKQETTEERTGQFVDEGGGDPSKNLHVVTEEELKNKK
ncbi:YtxH domain-containing protein [Staphylococcus massiliensis]|uniref:Staphylococcal protein n=1 Tax=Staphylococcus massiliensis S46 TaxID=1229783 RepID=K9AS63_9STAP|nr:YtxH domain-containing protein [Staphylococcus massiliensis]EKU50263.1 hypothetical protein C273_01435 [Staphylococcus massiliensis S46]MCG3399711.1 YtxH domain-containing protein [Staphylococcus massiliensis]MCG3412020.1 YtxH domain-containing protein [Staphylococcus massiliensis]PNZ99957.1 YtxH domain-containing protein [Staphylococcus massiliensis CCUG 55927]